MRLDKEDFRRWTLNMLSEESREEIRWSWLSALEKDQIIIRAYTTTLMAEKDFRIAFKVDATQVQGLSQNPLFERHVKSFLTFLNQATDYLVRDEHRLQELVCRVAHSHLNVQRSSDGGSLFKPQHFYTLSANIVDSLVQSLTNSLKDKPNKLHAEHLRYIWTVFVGAMSIGIRRALYKKLWRLGMSEILQKKKMTKHQTVA